MKKVIILSYFYPPCNLTAAQRILGFAKYLKKSGIYPIVVTRNWNTPISVEADLAKPSGDQEIHEKYETHEVYYLPFSGSKRDRLLTKYGENKHQLLRKVYTFREIFLESLEHFTPAKWLLYQKTKELIRDENIDTLIISGNPFWQFYFGYRLKKEFKKLRWIADYRDDWTTSDLGRTRGFFRDWIHKREVRNERKWLSNASFITSVTDVLTNRIGKHVQLPAHTIANGFLEKKALQNAVNETNNQFIISYTGYLYKEQKIEYFISALKKMMDEYDGKIKIVVQFIGSAFEKDTALRIRTLMEGYEDHVVLTERISRDEALELEAKSDLLLMVAYKNLKGIPGSKLYQYIEHQKPILLCPTDNDIVQEILEDTGLGVICNNEDEVLGELRKMLVKKFEKQPLVENIKSTNINKYSREHQVKLLAECIKQL